MTRSEARTNAFLQVFQLYANSDLELTEPVPLEDGLVLESDSFVTKLVNETVNHLEEIDQIIVENLRGWQLNRVSKVSLAILRISIAQLLYFSDIPVGPIINEAVNLSKRFGDFKDYQFVNGLLGRAAKTCRTSEES